jgi:mRNA (2'-O-methyladenosine-N6-)-methyltransferase
VDQPHWRLSSGTDIIFAERRGQSQKPEQIYELIERLVPNGKTENTHSSLAFH